MLKPLLRKKFSRHLWRTVHTRHYSNKKLQNVESTPEQESTSAIVDRMKQILEEKISSQSATTIETMKRSDESLNQILSKYDTLSTSLPNTKQAASYIKSEPILAHNKHAKDIYNSIPWSGTESVYDSNLRMIVDSKPKPINDPASLAYKKRNPTNNEKLAMARDISLDYKVNKPQKGKDKDGYNNDDDDGFREMYRERLLGPSMLINHSSTSVDFVEMLASNKINAKIDQTTGKFETDDMQNVRGKPLEKQHLVNCTDSNYFMNQVLNKQEVLPPWIESQQNLNRNIAQFRRNLIEMWSKSKKLHESDLKYIETKINLLNQEIRNYNLQCPSVSGHKFKLNKEKEIENAIKKALENPIKPKPIEVKNNTGFLDIFGGGSGGSRHTSAGSRQNIHIDRNIDPKLNVWQAIKDVFSLGK